MFTSTAREARVMRQVMALKNHYDVYVLGMGGSPFQGDPAVTFVELPPDDRSLPAKLLRRATLYGTMLGTVIPWFDVWRHSRRNCWRRALAWLIENRMDVLIAHELDTTALAAEVKTRHGTKVILDLHEYAPRENDNDLQFRLVGGPHNVRILKRWGRKADAAITVNEHFCDFYVASCGIQRPVAIHNVPARLPEPRPAKIDDGRIHLIHHGMCSPAREPHLSIEALRYTPEHVVLHFMFVVAHPGYLQRLRNMAAEMPGRVFFEEPQDYTGILPVIAKYHAGVYLSPNKGFNHTYMLPNKFFDFVSAGLPVIIGPNPSMRQFTEENGFGLVTKDFTPRALAEVLGQLTFESIAAMAVKADEFSRRMNAVTEHQKLITLIEQLLETRPQPESST